jgi:hypothetical protein
MFVKKKKVIKILARNLAVHQMDYNKWNLEDSDMAFEMRNNFANRIEAVLLDARLLGVEEAVIRMADDIVERATVY